MPVQAQSACCRRIMVGGKERLIVEADGGQRITLNDGPATVLIEDSSGNSIKLENGTVTVRPSPRLVLQSSSLEIDASSVTVNSAMVQCSGVLKADRVMTNTVIAAAYTPATGNLS